MMLTKTLFICFCLCSINSIEITNTVKKLSVNDGPTAKKILNFRQGDWYMKNSKTNLYNFAMFKPNPEFVIPAMDKVDNSIFWLRKDSVFSFHAGNGGLTGAVIKNIAPEDFSAYYKKMDHKNFADMINTEKNAKRRTLMTEALKYIYLEDLKSTKPYETRMEFDMYSYKGDFDLDTQSSSCEKLTDQLCDIIKIPRTLKGQDKWHDLINLLFKAVINERNLDIMPTPIQLAAAFMDPENNKVVAGKGDLKKQLAEMLFENLNIKILRRKIIDGDMTDIDGDKPTSSDIEFFAKIFCEFLEENYPDVVLKDDVNGADQDLGLAIYNKVTEFDTLVKAVFRQYASKVVDINLGEGDFGEYLLNLAVHGIIDPIKLNYKQYEYEFLKKNMFGMIGILI